MDPKNEFDGDETMEPKCHFKLRSSLKKTKSRNPLGNLDITEVTADITLAPPTRRVSFAASNYVKPFMDDPEKNTIWDNTYEEEVNHTDSTKSENTNTNLSEAKSNLQEITNADNIYYDQSMMEMEYSCLDQTVRNEHVKNSSSEDSLNVTSCILPNMNIENKTELSCLDMEFTCQWKNNIIQSNIMQKEIIINKDYSLRNSTVNQEADMSITYCFGSANIQEINVENKENILSPGDPAVYFPTVNCTTEKNLANQTGTEFTGTFSKNIIETVNHAKGIENNSLAVTTLNENINKENILPGDLGIVKGKKERLMSNQSEMEFTCRFPQKILETCQQKRTKGNIFTMAATHENLENKENILLPGNGCLPVVNDKKDTIFLPNQSEMEFTCSFPNKILEATSHSKEIKNNFITVTAVSENVEKENIIPGNITDSLAGVKDKRDRVFLPDQTGMEFTCVFPNNILERTNQPKEIKSNSLAMTTKSVNVKNKENILIPDSLITDHAKVTENKSLLQTKGNDCEMEFTCQFDAKQYSSLNKACKVNEFLNEKLDKTNYNLKVICPILKKDKRDNQNLRSNDVFNSNIENNSKCNLQQNTKYITNIVQEIDTKNVEAMETEPILIEPEAKLELIKPIKIREFGNIPIAVDITDLSIADTSNRKCDLKEHTHKYNVNEDHSPKNLIKNNLVSKKVYENMTNQGDSVNVQDDLISLNSPIQESQDNKVSENVVERDNGTKVAHVGNIPKGQNMKVRSENNKQVNTTETSTFVQHVESQLSETVEINMENPTVKVHLLKNFTEKQHNSNVSQVLTDLHNDYKENMPLDKFTGNISNQLCITKHQVKNMSLDESKTVKKSTIEIHKCMEDEKNECPITEEVSLLESIEDCILIDSITIPNEDNGASLSDNLSDSKTQQDSFLCKNDRNSSIKGQDSLLDEKALGTKVIYSVPMKGVSSAEFPSMQTSGMNPFNFSSIASMEDTQQLIQATFTKPSILKTDQFESDTWHSKFLPEIDVSQSKEKSEWNKSDTLGLQNETLKAESVLKNIQNKLVLSKFPGINYDQFRDSIKTSKKTSDAMEKLLLNFRFPEFPKFEKKTKKMSLNISFDGNSSGSLLELLDSGEDNNCIKEVLEPNKSLHEKIVDVCSRSNRLLNIKHFEENCYIFSTLYDCLLINVDVHPEDGRVTEIKTLPSLDESMEPLNKFVVKSILDKLKQSTLKSYLGPYYDVLSLMDHICLTVDKALDFQFEFLSLQKLYQTLTIHPDLSITMEILHNSPPIWWTIKFGMASVDKVDFEKFKLESKWGTINYEHIKQIIMNIDEGPDNLRTFLSNVFKYFERTQLRFKL